MDGVILFDKPPGVTSHDVVAQTRRRLGKGTKVGHAGTLDPFATGLLLVLVGRATRAQRFLMALPKSYATVARFGATSTTGDRDGEIVETGRVPDGDLPLPTGVIRQRPPAYSAVKVAGVRAYKRARRGEEVELQEREVTVYAFDELARDGARRTFAIRCSSGTYVRSLVADLGDAYCEELRRTAIGQFEVADADPQRIVPLNDAISFLPELVLTGDDARRAAHGVAVADPAVAERAVGAAVRLIDADGLIALAEPRTAPDGEALLKPVVGLRG
ncbi:MAG TPA: tRNA pseudouridine(55) synthase TruB [Conexibacter sp.]|jgi:tRNA pseudouridine55 synthase|nr:tRNA pseudouridine(55) synthase TruB [Conexibacter sp.]